MRKCVCRFAAFVFVAIGLTFGFPQSHARAEQAANAGVWNGFSVSLAADLQGNLWVGTEDEGIWRFDVASSQWQQFTTENGLGDNNGFALACDKLGRMWAGHLNHGVSVYSGGKWQNFDVTEGPLGERVFDIAACPTDGDVWIATNAGLTRYSLQNNHWSHFTRADGLPSDGVKAIAFDAEGNIIVGTLSDGVAMASAKDDYKSWRAVQGAPTMPLQPTGEGLPGNLVNDVLVAKDGTVYVGTERGLAYSRDAGKSWTFLRGANGSVRVKSLSPPVREISERKAAAHGVNAPAWEVGAPLDLPTPLLLEDDVTCLAQDASGVLWIGHTIGFEARRPEADSPFGKAILYSSTEDPAPEDDGDNTIAAILSMPARGTLVARYGGSRAGVRAATPPDAPVGRPTTTDAPKATLNAALPPLPAPAKAPGLAEINDLLQHIGAAHAVARREAKSRPVAVALADDWRTQGDWLGRYGRYWAILNAMLGTSDYMWGAGPEKVFFNQRVDPYWPNGDALRYFISELHNDNPKTLEIPSIYMDSRVQQQLTTWDKNRRQSEWVDIGDASVPNADGPHLYCTLQVPDGVFTLSLYAYNKMAHVRQGRFADYGVSIREHPAEKELWSIEDFASRPELARGRISEFWNGVYKRFLVRGPTRITFQVNRNYSYCTYFSGVMLDAINEEPAPYFQTKEEWQTQKTKKIAEAKTLLEMETGSAAWTQRFAPATSQAEGAERLMLELERLQEIDPVGWAEQGRRFYAPLLRHYEKVLAASGEPKVVPVAADKIAAREISVEKRNLYTRLGTCFLQMGLHAQWEECQHRRGLESARHIEKSLRWDGKSNSSGKGYEIISAWMEEKRRAEKAEQPQ